MRRRRGHRMAGSTSPPAGTACSTSSPSTPSALGGGRRRPGPARSTACRARRKCAPGRGLSRPELEHLPLPGRLRGPGGHLRHRDRRRRSRSGTGRRRTPPGSLAARREPYRRKLTLDFAAGEAAVIPGDGGAQGALFFLSDLLDDLLFCSVFTYQGRGWETSSTTSTSRRCTSTSPGGSTGASVRSGPTSSYSEGDRVVPTKRRVRGDRRPALSVRSIPPDPGQAVFEHSDRVRFPPAR